MSEFRRNPLTEEWTLYAANRKNRPYEFEHRTQVKTGNGEKCPFCGGHEGWTTSPVYQDGDDASWQIRVFPNMFPAVGGDCPEEKAEGFYEQRAGRGNHEVLVDTREHTETIASFSAERIEQILAVLQERHHALLQQEFTAYVQIFKNCGPSAGMSIRHSHWQLLGLPLVPGRISKMAEKMKKEDCLFCRILEEEKSHKRIAAENEAFLAIAPYASRFAYELWLAPKRHMASFEEMTSKERKLLAEMLRELLQKIVKLKEEIGYNICLLDAPKNGDFHWHLEIYPRIGGFAGFEYATDCFINLVLPEQAAAYFRGEVE